MQDVIRHNTAPDTAAPERRTAPETAAPDAPLERLRRIASRCRTLRRIDLFHACAMLAPDRRAAGRAFATALLRTLGQGLGRSPVFFAPGAAETSFDERWLLALIAAAERGDDPSFVFLLRSRLAPHTHRATAFLVRNLASGLDTL